MSEYKVVDVAEGGVERELNKWAKEGWRLVTVTKTLSGSFYTLYLERATSAGTAAYLDAQERYPGTYPKRSW